MTQKGNFNDSNKVINKFSESISNIMQIDDIKPVKLMSDNERVRELQEEVSVLCNRINKLKFMYKELNKRIDTLEGK